MRPKTPTCPQAIGRDVSWKTAPRPAVLAAYSDIGYAMISVVSGVQGPPPLFVSFVFVFVSFRWPCPGH